MLIKCAIVFLVVRIFVTRVVKKGLGAPLRVVSRALRPTLLRRASVRSPDIRNIKSPPVRERIGNRAEPRPPDCRITSYFAFGRNRLGFPEALKKSRWLARDADT